MTHRLGLFPLGSTLWQAGTTYLENFLAAMQGSRRTAKPGISWDTVLLVPQGTPEHTLGRACELADQVEYVATSGLETGDERERLLQAHQIDASFEIYGNHFSKPVTRPRIGWVTDFQHVHLPDLARADLWEKRDQACRMTIKHATRVAVSSFDARRDLEAMDPIGLAKTDVLRFVAQVDQRVYLEHSDEICHKYHLPQRFFYLPNQFWRHKNHETLIAAMEILARQGVVVHVVCTGNTSDHRDMQYFGRLLHQIALAGLRQQVHFLGIVEHSQVLALMRQSLKVVNPSLFEGWSTTVEEAKSLGKGLILSDLPVHLEQNPAASAFFERHDPASLAACLATAWRDEKSGPDLALEARARAAVANRMREFGDAIRASATSALDHGAIQRTG